MGTPRGEESVTSIESGMYVCLAMFGEIWSIIESISVIFCGFFVKALVLAELTR